MRFDEINISPPSASTDVFLPAGALTPHCIEVDRNPPDVFLRRGCFASTLLQKAQVTLNSGRLVSCVAIAGRSNNCCISVYGLHVMPRRCLQEARGQPNLWYTVSLGLHLFLVHFCPSVTSVSPKHRALHQNIPTHDVFQTGQKGGGLTKGSTAFFSGSFIANASECGRTPKQMQVDRKGRRAPPLLAHGSIAATPASRKSDKAKNRNFRDGFECCCNPSSPVGALYELHGKP